MNPQSPIEAFAYVAGALVCVYVFLCGLLLNGLAIARGIRELYRDVKFAATLNMERTTTGS